MDYSADDKALMQQGFRDALERRDLPLPEYTREQVKVWRIGLNDGWKWQKYFSDAYYGTAQTWVKEENSLLTKGFMSVINGSNIPASEMSKADRSKWNQGRRAALRFLDVYKDDMHKHQNRVETSNERLKEILANLMKLGEGKIS